MFTNLANVVCDTNYFDEISDDLIIAFKDPKISKHKTLRMYHFNRMHTYMKLKKIIIFKMIFHLLKVKLKLLNFKFIVLKVMTTKTTQ
jgi:hypothetical protein